MELSFCSRDENGSERPSETGPRWTEAKCVSSPTTVSSHIQLRLKKRKEKKAILQTEEGKQIPRIIFIYLYLGCVHYVSLFSLFFFFSFLFVLFLLLLLQAIRSVIYLAFHTVVYSCRGATVMFSVSTKRNSKSEICRSVRGKRTCLQGRHC